MCHRDCPVDAAFTAAEDASPRIVDITDEAGSSGSGGGGGSAPGASIKKAVNTQKAAAALQGKAKRK